MVAPQRESDLEQWIDISEKLRPIQNLAVIGLQFLRPNLPLSIIATTDPMEEENIRATERWASSRFRQLLLFYCQHYKKPQAIASAELLDKAELVKALAPLLVSTLSIPLGGFARKVLKIHLDASGKENISRAKAQRRKESL